MKKITLSLIALASIFTSCDSDPTALNIDPKNPTTVSPDYIYNSAEVGLASTMVSPSVNTNIFRTFTQQITETQYTDESKYNLLKRGVPNVFWTNLYGELNKLHQAQESITASSMDTQVKANQLAAIEALTVYIYSVLVDTYGDVPYTQAIDSNVSSPVYDDGLTIYKDLITRINAVLPTINGGKSFSKDAIFKNSAAITTFLNTLKLRLGINLAIVDPATAKTTIESAAPGVINSNSSNIGLLFDKDGLFTSTLYQDLVQSGRNDWVAANTLVNKMNPKNDPRRASYFTLVNGEYKGGLYGKTNNYALFSHFNDLLLIPNSVYNFFEYSETEFMLAEAAAAGFNVGGTAESHFIAGITASMNYYGVSSANRDTYLASNAYASLPGTDKEKIGYEAWIASYNRGFESWENSRRTDFLVFVKPSTFDVPNRMPYPIKEVSVNNTNRLAAEAKQWGAGGDVQKNKVFWDKL